MTAFPSGVSNNVNTSNLDSATDQPKNARADLYTLTQRVNQMINSFNANSGICGLDAQGKVDSAKLIGQIDTAQLATDAVDGTKIEDNAVDSEHIANGAVDYDHISFGSTATDLGGASPANNLVPTQAATKAYVDNLVGNVDVSNSIEEFATNEWEGIMIRSGTSYGISASNNHTDTLSWGSSSTSQTNTYKNSMFHHPLSGWDGDADSIGSDTHHYGESGYLCTFSYGDAVSNRWRSLVIDNRQTRDAILEISGVLALDLRTSGNSHQSFRCDMQLNDTTVKTLSMPSNYTGNGDSWEMPFCYAAKITNMDVVKLKFHTYHTASHSYYTSRFIRSCVVKVTYL